MKKDVKSAIADILKEEGIEYVFGCTGGSIMQMWEAANNAGIKLILNKQEGNAVYMADGLARLTKKPTVVLGTVGPGVTNMTTGLATAFLDSTPMIAIGGTVKGEAFGRNAVQDSSGRGRSTEQRLVLKSVCKQAMLAPSPEAVPLMVREAFRIALSGRQGPVYLEIPNDFWDKEIDYKLVKPNQYKNISLPGCNKTDVEMIVKRFYDSKHPLILVGEGALEAGIQEKIIEFLNKPKVPFGVSPIAKNIVDEYNSLYLGVARAAGQTQKIYEYMRKSDFILFLGDRMQEWELNWHDQSLVEKAVLAQIDPDWDEIGRVFPIDYSAVGSISSAINVFPSDVHSNSRQLESEVEDLNKKFPRAKRSEDGNGINPLNVNNIVEELAANDATIVCDTGYAKSMAIMKFRTKLSQNFIVADKNGPMGYSVPAALGAALATNKEVICFVGDGGFQMSLNELGTALNYGLKVIYIVENNGGCISIVNYHTKVYGHHCADTFENPDFSKLAEAYQMKGFTVRTTEEFEKAFRQAQKEKTSVVIDAKIDQSLMVWE